MSIARLLLPSQRRQRRGARRRSARDDGFSIVEVMVAMAVFAVVAMFMTQTLGSGLRGVLGGKRREVATQEGQRLLEIARSLSYDAIGLSSTDPTLATDPAIETKALGTPPLAKKAYRSGSTWEPLLFVASPSSDFSPHIATLSRGSTDLTRYVYITGIDDNNDGTFDLKRVTVRVTWDDSGSRGPINEIRVQTKVTRAGLLPTGTGTTTTPLTGDSFATGGTITVGASSLLGLSSPLNIALPATTGATDYRAVSSANCTAKSVSLNVMDALPDESDSVSVGADDDSRTTTPSTASQSKPGTLSIPGVGNLLGASGNSPVSCEADVVPLAHELGTAAGLSTTLNTQTNVSALDGLINWLLTLASVDGEPVTQEIDHDIVSGQREVHSRSSAALGVVQALKLPFAGLSNGLVQVDGLSYSASVRGAEGTPSAAPAIAAPSFTVRVFDNGSRLGAACTTGITLTPGITVARSGSYCVFTVVPSASGFRGLHIPVTHNFTELLGLNVVSLSYDVQIDIMPPTKNTTAGTIGTNGEKTWTAEYTPLSVSAALDVGIPLLSLSLVDANVDLNLGKVQAKACAGATCPIRIP